MCFTDFREENLWSIWLIFLVLVSKNMNYKNQNWFFYRNLNRKKFNLDAGFLLIFTSRSNDFKKSGNFSLKIPQNNKNFSHNKEISLNIWHDYATICRSIVIGYWWQKKTKQLNKCSSRIILFPFSVRTFGEWQELMVDMLSEYFFHASIVRLNWHDH